MSKSNVLESEIQSRKRRGHLSDLVVTLDEDVLTRLRCPVCRGRLGNDYAGIACLEPSCGERYPVVNRVPVLINERESLFAREDFIRRRNTTFDLTRSPFKERLDRLLPDLGRNLSARGNYGDFAERVLQRSARPVVLVIGGSILGQGFEALAQQPEIRLIETDVSFGPRTQVVCDARDLPFADSSFDGVIIQAVLQYVPDPARCVAEIERVLVPGGLVYAEAAFMQQVVHGRYDFTRFTHLGLRRLFRCFGEVRSGPVAGPGMALAWAAHFFLLSFARRKLTRSFLHATARLTLFWLKYFDRPLLNRPGCYDAASGFYFLGERGCHALNDREVVRGYRGAQQ